MSKPPETYRAYRALLRLYPKSHRQEYGGQMLQTLDDMLADHQSKSERMEIWLRICRELPLNIIEEHIHNLQGANVATILKDSNKRAGIILGIGAIIVLGVSLGIFRGQGNLGYSPTTFAQLQRTDSKPACLQKPGTNNIEVDSKDRGYVENTIATSIIDAAAGTNVDAYFKTYDGKTATGTTAYSGKYGTYNFTVEKNAGNAGDPQYFGHWKVTRFESCRT